MHGGSAILVLRPLYKSAYTSRRFRGWGSQKYLIFGIARTMEDLSFFCQSCGSLPPNSPAEFDVNVALPLIISADSCLDDIAPAQTTCVERISNNEHEEVLCAPTRFIIRNIVANASRNVNVLPSICSVQLAARFMKNALLLFEYGRANRNAVAAVLHKDVRVRKFIQIHHRGRQSVR